MKNFDFVKKILFVMFLSFLAGYFISKSKDNNFRDEFYIKHQDEIERKTDRLLRLDHDFETREELFKYSNNNELNDLEYKYNTGAIEKEEYTKKLMEIIDNYLERFNNRFDEYMERVESIDIPRYKSSDKLKNAISISKALAILSFIGFVFFILFDLLRL